MGGDHENQTDIDARDLDYETVQRTVTLWALVIFGAAFAVWWFCDAVSRFAAAAVLGALS
jgi:hypothetical protein